MNLPFTRKEVDYLRYLVEQEKVRIIDDISSIRARESMPADSREIMLAISGPNYFRTKTHLKKLEQSVTVLKGIENNLYP